MKRRSIYSGEKRQKSHAGSWEERSTGFLRINEEGEDGKETWDGYYDQSQEHWGMLRGKDSQLNLNKTTMKV